MEARSAALTRILRDGWHQYARRLAEPANRHPWWDAVILTASSAAQAERYELELTWRRQEGRLIAGVPFLVVPDWHDQRIGSGGATLHALAEFARRGLPGGEKSSLEAWWQSHRVLMIHSGGDSRRLPAYSVSGKLFTTLPIASPWGAAAALLDVALALSTNWISHVPPGLLVSSGDVVLVFDAQELDWEHPGVCGAAMRRPLETGSRHGVYVLGDEGKVYAYFQKPSAAQLEAAGGLLPGGEVALDTGLLRFDAPLTARLTEFARGRFEGKRGGTGSNLFESLGEHPPAIDLYQHMTLALTGQYQPTAEDGPPWKALAAVLEGIPFRCSLVEGEFTHVGTTSHFRRIMNEGAGFARLQRAHDRLGVVRQPGLSAAGVVVDSVLVSGEVEPGAVVVECHLEAPVRAAKGSILHGLNGFKQPVEAPEDTVVHQVPITSADGVTGFVFRVFGVDDDPKQTVTSGRALWLGEPILEALETLGVSPADVWGDVPWESRTLWNARLFVAGKLEEAWRYACGLMGLAPLDAAWRTAPRLSLEDSTRLADTEALAQAARRRSEAGWRMGVLDLAASGADLRPLLSRAPGLATLAEAARQLGACAQALQKESPTEAASRWFQASLLCAQAGLEGVARRDRARAFRCVRRAVEAGSSDVKLDLAASAWQHSSVEVSAPPRIDFGGGWSDTPPFCLDWGGTVLNAAITVGGGYPIRALVRRLEEPVIRCVSGETGEQVEYTETAEALAPPGPGNPFSIQRAAIQLTGLAAPGRDLRGVLRRCGGGLEIRTAVSLPMGSGLGTSSILAAALLRALAEMASVRLPDDTLSDLVMRLEQNMTTGGGWQDQAGGIYPGAKLISSAPGLRQRLRVQPVAWSAGRQAEFLERFVFFSTGIRRVAKNLLAEVVGRYLARDSAVVPVLHSIKTLAQEMYFALQEGEWGELGRLMDRHWKLNQVLDPNTTNAPIDALLRSARPHLAGAKLAGAGGGGFLMLLARSAEEAGILRQNLSSMANELPASVVHSMGIAEHGMRVSQT